MKRLLLILLIFVTFTGLGCWRRAANTVENTNVAETPVAVEQFSDANAALAEGNRLLDENQTDAAIEVLKQAIGLNPDLGEAHFKLGIAYALQEHQQEQTGERLPGEVVEGNKQYKTKSDRAFEKAVDAFQKWLKTNPDDDNAHYFLGMTYSKLNKDEDAEKEFKQAVKLKPEDTEYQTELGSVLIKLAKYYEAVPVLKKAVELDPSNDRAIALLDDAEAGRKRVEYISKNTNQPSNKAVNANIDANSNSNSSPANRPPANSKPANAQPTPQKEVPRGRVVPTPGKTPGRPNS